MDKPAVSNALLASSLFRETRTARVQQVESGLVAISCVGQVRVNCPLLQVLLGHLFLLHAVPPVLANATFNVSEGAAANTPVGAPLNASQPSPNVALTYQIVGGNGSTLFKVGICDGQIRLKAAGVLDYITANVYTLIITTTPNGFAPSAINSTFTIDILYVNKV